MALLEKFGAIISGAPVADCSLVPNGELKNMPNMRGWLLQRHDILANGGNYSYRVNGRVVNVEGKPVERDVQREKKAIHEYLSWTDGIFPEYSRLLRHLVSNPQSEKVQKGLAGVTELGRRTLAPMEPNCRVSIIIPARDEEQVIYQTLSNLSQQKDKNGNPIDTSLFEITVIVNCKEGKSYDKTYEEIKKFKTKFPQLRINALEVKVQEKWSRVGFMRKLVTDLTLLRAIARGNGYTQPLYIASEDADLVKTDQRQVTKVISQLDNAPWLDAISGHTEMISDNDLAFLKRRSEDFVTAISRKLIRNLSPEQKDFWSSRIWTYGTNTAFCAETYALIRGYNWDAAVGEDLDLGHRISLLRGSVDGRGRFIPDISTVAYSGIRSASSPRRVLWELANKANGYTTQNFNKAEVRTTSIQDFEKIAPCRRFVNDEYTQERVQKALNFTYKYRLQKVLPDTKLYMRAMRRCLIYLGFESNDFRIDERDVKILNLNNLIRALEKRRQRLSGEKPQISPEQEVGLETRYAQDKQKRTELSQRLQKEGATLTRMLTSFGNDYTLLENLFREKTGTELVRDPVDSLRKDIPITKKATVLIPVYNNQDALTKSLVALNCSSFARKYPNQFEVLVVDDGSTKGDIIEAVKAAGSLDINIRVVKQANSGKVGALYTGAQLAKGDVVITIDPDFLPYPQAIEEVMKRHEIVDNIVTIGFRRELDPQHPEIVISNIPSTLSQSPSIFTDDIRFTGDNNFNETKWFKASGFNRPVFDGHWQMRMSSFCHEVCRSVPRTAMIKAMAGYTSGITYNPGDEILLHRLIAQGLYIIPATSAVGYHLSHDSHHNPKRSQERRTLMRRLAEEPFPKQEENPYLSQADVIWQHRSEDRVKQATLPSHRMRHADTATLYVKAGFYKESLNYIEKALKIDPTSAGLHALRAIVLLENNKIKDAQECIEQAKAIKINHGLVQYAEGLLLIKTRNYADAKGKIEQAIVSSHPLAVRLARQYIPEKDLDMVHEANKYLQESQTQRGRKGKAVIALRAALIKDPNNQQAKEILVSLIGK